MDKIAQKYIESGLSILPVKLDKSPDCPSWKDGFLSIEFAGKHGIGIICGEKSGGVECIDFDNKFGDAKKIISDFMIETKPIFDKYKLVIESTQSGGYHLIYRCSFVAGNLKLASRPKIEGDKFKPIAIIETRGEGGYFVSDPTKGYKVIKGELTNIPTIEVSDRNHLIEIAKSFNQWFDQVNTEYENNNKPGDFLNKQPGIIDEVKSVLIQNGWNEIKNSQWRRPGKKEGISATLGKAAENIFYNFSSSAYPFEENKGYTPFQVIGLLKYNGDFKTFAREILEKYNLSDYKNIKQPYNKPKYEPKTETEIEDLLKKSFIDPHLNYERPPTILEINHGDQVNWNFKRLFTLSNFSAITGKGKSKKTFFSSLILAALATNGIYDNKFRSVLPENKMNILQFDTEQADYDTFIVAKRIHKMSGGIKDHFGTFNLREFEPQTRVDIIFKAIEKFKDNIGFILIDGIADLIATINDEEVANRIIVKLMEWTKKYNIHICNVIHQNKANDYATGWIGSALIKKSEVVIGIEKAENKNASIVSCQNIRGSHDFDSFTFSLTDEGMPKIDWNNNYIPLKADWLND